MLVKETAEIETGMEESSVGTRQTYGKNQVWFGEIERKLAKLKTTFTYRSSCSLFYGVNVCLPVTEIPGLTRSDRAVPPFHLLRQNIAPKIIKISTGT